jgi:hypothetical protein
MCSAYAGDTARAEREFVEGIELAEAVGELRVAVLLKGNFAVLQAGKASDDKARGVTDSAGDQWLLDEALRTALDNFQAAEKLGLLNPRFEGHRCLAEVRFRRGELDEAERLCAAASELVSATESRVSRLWLGPLYVEVLVALAERAAAGGRPDEAAARRAQAAEHLARYRELVAVCQSPRFTREAHRLAEVIAPEK